jgi:hypothetical protein
MMPEKELEYTPTYTSVENIEYSEAQARSIDS